MWTIFFGTISGLKPFACEGVKNDRTTGVLVVTGSAGVAADRAVCGDQKLGQGRPREI